MNSAVRLDRAPLHTPLTLVAWEVPEAVQRRLVALGLRRGVQLSLVHRLAGGGRIVSVGGCRLALGRPVLRQLVGEEVAS